MLLRKIFSVLPLQRLAVVPFGGPIFKSSTDEYIRLFRALRDMGNIKGVMLELESPGGAATASEALFESLRRIDEKKPLYCYAMMAASGGYMAALGARKIYAPPTGMIGSIGVLSVKPVLRDLMERFGVRLEVMKKGRMKDMSLFHRESTEEELRSWDALHEAVYERFVEMVAQKRGIEAGKVRELATGELFSAARAKELGLIDGISDFESFMDELSGETGVRKRRAVTVKPKKPLVKRLMSEAAGTFVEELRSRLY